MKTSFWNRLLDLVSPRGCAVCGRRLGVAQSVFCAPCELHIPFTFYERSPYDNPMARLVWGHISVERAAALFFYEPGSPASQMIYDLKYHGRYEIGRSLGQFAARRFDAEDFFSDIDALVPIPLTWRRRLHRGYNQSYEIARGVKTVTGLPIYNKVVRRIRFTQSQTARHSSERWENVEGAFRLVAPQKIEGCHLLLIDDIITTGATLVSCARELARVPGVRISILTLGCTR